MLTEIHTGKTLLAYRLNSYENIWMLKLYHMEIERQTHSLHLHMFGVQTANPVSNGSGINPSACPLMDNLIFLQGQWSDAGV